MLECRPGVLPKQAEAHIQVPVRSAKAGAYPFVKVLPALSGVPQPEPQFHMQALL